MTELRKLTDMGGYGRVDRAVVARCSSAQVIALLAVLACRTWKDGKCNPSLATLADDLRCSEATVTRWIKQAEADGVLTVVRTRGTSHYTIPALAPVQDVEPAPVQDLPDPALAPVQAQNLHQCKDSPCTSAGAVLAPVQDGNSTSSNILSNHLSSPSREVMVTTGVDLVLASDPKAREREVMDDYLRFRAEYPGSPNDDGGARRMWRDGMTAEEREACWYVLPGVKRWAEYITHEPHALRNFIAQRMWERDWLKMGNDAIARHPAHRKSGQRAITDDLAQRTGHETPQQEVLRLMRERREQRALNLELQDATVLSLTKGAYDED